VIGAEPGAHVFGVACSQAAVKATRSQKSTETTLRSTRSTAGAASLTGAAQDRQNRNSPGELLTAVRARGHEPSFAETGLSRVAVERMTTRGSHWARSPEANGACRAIRL
jgi:hypothetical protein